MNDSEWKLVRLGFKRRLTLLRGWPISLFLARWPISTLCRHFLGTFCINFRIERLSCSLHRVSLYFWISFWANHSNLAADTTLLYKYPNVVRFILIVDHLPLPPYIIKHPLYLLTQTISTFPLDNLHNPLLITRILHIIIHYPLKKIHLQLFDKFLFIWDIFEQLLDNVIGLFLLWF